MKIDSTITYESLANIIKQFWELAELKTSLNEKEYNDTQGALVFTLNGKYKMLIVRQIERNTSSNLMVKN